MTTSAVTSPVGQQIRRHRCITNKPDMSAAIRKPHHRVGMFEHHCEMVLRGIGVVREGTKKECTASNRVVQNLPRIFTGSLGHSCNGTIAGGLVVRRVAQDKEPLKHKRHVVGD